MLLRPIDYQRFTLHGVAPDVPKWDCSHFPDAMFLIWRVNRIDLGHYPHAVLLDEHTAVMPTTLIRGLWFAAFRRRPYGLLVGMDEGDHLVDVSDKVLVLTGANTEETLRAVLTTMQLTYNLSPIQEDK